MEVCVSNILEAVSIVDLQKFIWISSRIKDDYGLTDIDAITKVVSEYLKDSHTVKQYSLRTKAKGDSRKQRARIREVLKVLPETPKTCPNCLSRTWTHPDTKEVQPAVKLIDSMKNMHDFEFLCRVCRWSKYVGI